MIKKSSIMLLLTISLLVLVSSNSLMIFTIANMITKDAEAINLTGIVRDSIQRIAKLETNDINSAVLIANIDRIIADFKNGKITIKGSSAVFNSLLTDIDGDWQLFKDSIADYRSAPNDYNRHLLVEKSELLWQETTTAVQTAQELSAKKIGYFNYLIIFFIINTTLIITMFLLTRMYVRKQLEYAVNHDFLTGIYNRTFYSEHLLHEIHKAERYYNGLFLIMLDIDHFKRVNDTYGHDIGDHVLKELTSLINNHIRKSDIFSRIGGEEFVVILADTDRPNALALGEKIRKLVEGHSFERAGEITISIGIAEYIKGDTGDSLFKRADNALYKAKSQGRNRVEFP
ncbi:MAG: GGDEF domain-containing protein [Peptococcaceae bacterium]